MEYHTLGGGVELDHVVELVWDAQCCWSSLGAPLVNEVHLPTWISLARNSTCVSKMTIMNFDIGILSKDIFERF